MQSKMLGWWRFAWDSTKKNRNQDSDDELPVILDITSQKQKKAESSEHDSQYKLETLKEMFPSIDEAVLHDAINEAKDDINLAVSCILEGRSSAAAM